MRLSDLVVVKEIFFYPLNIVNYSAQLLFLIDLIDECHNNQILVGPV